jgi:hypothetical protein
MGIGPVGLDGYGVKTLFFNKAASNFRPDPVELGRAMAGFTKQNEFLPAGRLYQGIVIAGGSPQWPRMSFQYFNELVI